MSGGGVAAGIVPPIVPPHCITLKRESAWGWCYGEMMRGEWCVDIQ